MVNILVPTDFSDFSKVAINFAVKVANKLDGNVTLLHVVNIIQPTRSSMRFMFKTVEQELMDIAKEDFEELLKDINKQNKTATPIKYKVSLGTSFNGVLNKEAKKLRTGLIVMGTRGAGGLAKVIVGSNTASLIDSSNVPVLAVPELAEFKSFKNIVYATDMVNLDKELKTFLPYAKTFDSMVHVVHVTPSDKNVKAIEEKIYKAALGKINYKKFTVNVLVNKKADKAVEEYVDKIKADLVTTFAYEDSFYKKLFNNRSLAKQMAFQSIVPLLTFKQK